MMRFAVACMFIGCLVSGCGDDAGSDSGRAIRIGVLFAFSGDAAATGSNLERGVMLATDLVNDRFGGIADHPIELVFRDSFSDPERAGKAARELADEGVVAVIGPGGDELVQPVFAALTEENIPLISPLASTRLDALSTAEAPWFRLSPSTTVLGEGLAKAAFEKGNTQVAVVHAADAYHRELGQSFASRLTSLGATVERVAEVDEASSTFGDLAKSLVTARGLGLDGVMLAMNPLPAARLVNEVSVLSKGHNPRWLLTPRLKTEIFLLNTSPNALEGALGIAPNVFSGSPDEFISAFREAWSGDAPFESTHFAYDGSALLLIAIDRALHHGDLNPDRLRAAIFDVASVGGVQVKWNDFSLAFERDRAGGQLQYTGVTGPILFTEEGRRRTGTAATWGIEAGKITRLE